MDAKSDPSMRTGIKIMEQMTAAMFEEAQMKCYDDLRLDFAVDDINRCWLIKACSLDFMTLKPAQEYHESPHKEKFI